MIRFAQFLLCLVGIFYFPTRLLSAQDWKKIKNDNEFICGEGKSSTVKQADLIALQDLLSNISVQVSSSFQTDMRESVINEQYNDTTINTFIVNTYVNGTLNNTEKIILHDEPNAHVFRYIRKSEIEKIFEDRKVRIKDYVDEALKAELKGKIDIALRNYYWAYLLLQSLQRPSELTYLTSDRQKRVLINWLPQQILSIFNAINVQTISRNGEDTDILLSYQGKPVNSLDFCYQDGREWTPIASAKDGMARLELASGYKAPSYRIRIEFQYKEESRQDPDINMLMKRFEAPKLLINSSYISCSSEAIQSPPTEQIATTNSEGETYISVNSYSTIDPQRYKKPVVSSESKQFEEIIKEITDAVQTKQFDKVNHYFSLSGLKSYNALIKYGNASILKNSPIAIYEKGDEIIGKGVVMQFQFKNGLRKSFVEDVIFTFSKDKQIENISFGLGQTASDDILGKNAWPQEIRLALMQFLENYKTAYALKDIEYIEGIFDDDAIIITGTQTKRLADTRSDQGTISLPQSAVQYVRYNKNTYLAHLKQSFKSKEFINIRFSNNEVIKLGKGGETYAIQITQDYYSSNYGDHGYLMLLVDINDPQKPIIRLRTWQPDRDPNFGLYGPELFR